MLQTLKHVIFQTGANAIKNNILIFGGYAAYTSLLAFFPFLIFLMSVAAFIGSADASEQTIQYMLEYMPKEIVEAIAPTIRNILDDESFGLLTLGGIGALWISSSGIEGLRFGLNQAYAVPETRPFWKTRLQSLGLVIAGSLIFFLLALGLILWPLLTDFLFRYFSLSLDTVITLNIIRFSVAAILLFSFFGALYRILPDRHHYWRNVWPGALLATILWLALAQLFSVYVTHSGSYDATYGSIGGVIITLIFFHYSASLILLGAELNYILEREKRTRNPYKNDDNRNFIRFPLKQ